MPSEQRKRKKPKTPAENPELLGVWKQLFKQYTIEDGLRKWSAYKRISGIYGTSTSNVEHWLDEDVRRKRNESKKNQARPDRQTETYRSKEATRKYLYRNIDHYVLNAFDEPPSPLTADEITLNIQDNLTKEERPPILMRNKTLLDLVHKYETEHETKLLVEIPETEPPTYLPVPKYK